MATSESKTLMVAVVALVAFAGIMVWMLTGTSEGDVPAEELAGDPVLPGPAPSATAPAPAPAQPAPKPATAAPAQPIAPDSDLFAGTMPDFMVDLHARVLDKKWLGAPEQRQLYEFGKQNKNDARPQLLLAWDSMNREWDGIAVRMYRIAYRADRRAKDDPTMLRDLLAVASRFDRTEFREASEIIKEAYGGEALPRIEEEIARFTTAGEVARAARMSRLRDSLRN
ncbi:MAG TPA: hypothetical protein VK509_02495 [Polyangiales bacterium]|nr:hypothetical protein [Polyangiales bacterium]